MTDPLTAHLISVLIAVPFAHDRRAWCSSAARSGSGAWPSPARCSIWRWRCCFGGGSTPPIQGLQFVERIHWMPTFNIHYAVGVDGISVLLVVLTAVLSPLCVLCSWKSIDTT